MRMRFLAPLLLLPALAQAQMYRWTDANGKVHYSDRPPVSGAKNVQKQATPISQGSQAPLPYALLQAAKNFPVTLYASDGCKEACAQAREILNKRGVPYSEVMVADDEDLAALRKLSGGDAGPVITVGREVIRGFEGGAYKAALDDAGYPASSMLPRGVQAMKPVVKQVPKTAPAAAEAEAAPAAPPQEAAGAAPPR